MRRNKKIGHLGSIIVFIMLIVLVITTNTNISWFSKGENIISKIVMPVQNVYSLLKNKIKKNNSYFQTLDSLKDENAELKKQNDELQSKLEELQILKSENNILKEYVNLAEEYSEFNCITAYIINKNISNLSETFVINVGTDDGVYENMAVMGKNGLVGHTISATKSTAKVQPVIDAASNISGVTVSTRNNVIVKGQLGSNNELIVNQVQTDTQLFEGDIIETSGLGGIYPKGITIGKIRKIVETKNVAEKYAILETNVDFENLEYVLVIKK